MALTPLQTERLTLRVYTLSDIPALMPLIGAREGAATTLRIPHPYAESDARDYIAGTEEDLSSGSGLRLGIVLRERYTLCGGVGLRIEPDHRRAELGYWVGVPYWGKGYATEAARAVVKYGFGTLGCTHLRQPLREQSCVGQSLEKNRHTPRRQLARSCAEVGRVPRPRDLRNAGSDVEHTPTTT